MLARTKPCLEEPKGPNEESSARTFCRWVLASAKKAVTWSLSTTRWGTSLTVREVCWPLTFARKRLGRKSWNLLYRIWPRAVVSQL